MAELASRFALKNIPRDDINSDLDDADGPAAPGVEGAQQIQQQQQQQQQPQRFTGPRDPAYQRMLIADIRGAEGNATAADTSAATGAGAVSADKIKPVSSLSPSFAGPTLLRQESFVPYLKAVDALCSHTDIIHLLLDDGNCGWGWSLLGLQNPLSPSLSPQQQQQAGGVSAAPAPSSSSAAAAGPSASAVEKPSLPRGRDIETKTFLGRLLGLGPQKSDFVTVTGDDLIQQSTELELQLRANGVGDGRGGGGDNDDEAGGAGDGDGGGGGGGTGASADAAASSQQQQKVGVHRLLPPVAPQAEIAARRQAVSAQLEAVNKQIREGAALHASYCRSIVAKMVKAKGGSGREAVFGWVGRLIDCNVVRTQDVWASCRRNPQTTALSTGALIYNATMAMLSLCQPFLDPTTPLSSRIDPRYLSAHNTVNGNCGGRCTTVGREERMAPFVNYGEDDTGSSATGGSSDGGSGDQQMDSGSAASAGANQQQQQQQQAAASDRHGSGSGTVGTEVEARGAVGASWLDARNLARQKQFKEKQKALLKNVLKNAAIGGSGVTGAWGLPQAPSSSAGAGASMAAAPPSVAQPGRSISPQAPRAGSGSGSGGGRLPAASPTTSASSASAAAGAGTGTGMITAQLLASLPGNRPITAPVVHHPITEMFWLTVRLAHTGIQSSIQRENGMNTAMYDQHRGLLPRVNNILKALRSARNGGLVQVPANANPLAQMMMGQQAAAGGRVATKLDSRIANTYLEYRSTLDFSVAPLVEVRMIEQAWSHDPSPTALDPLLQLYRLLAVVMVRCVDPASARMVPGLCEDGDHILAAAVATAVAGVDGQGQAQAPIRATASSAAASASAAAPPSLPPPSLRSSSAPVMPPTLPMSSLSSPGTALRASASLSSAAAVAPVAMLPLPDPQLPLMPPFSVICQLPDTCVTDVGRFFEFMNRSEWPIRRMLFDSDVLKTSAVVRDFLTFLTVFISSPLHLASPFNRGNLLRSLQAFIPSRYDPHRSAAAGGISEQAKKNQVTPTPLLHQVIGSHSLCVRHLMPSLADFHTDIASSGSHTAFYDKFMYRWVVTSMWRWGG